MQQQLLAEERLSRLFRQIMAIIVLIVLLFFLGWRYFDSIDGVVESGLSLKQQKLFQTANLVRAQWFREGKAGQLALDWEVMGEQNSAPASVVVRISVAGWPMPTYGSEAGCRKLWLDLMGYEWDKHQLVLYVEAGQNCRFIERDGLALEYNWQSGAVSLLSGVIVSNI